jgi:hypothetical protein
LCRSRSPVLVSKDLAVRIIGDAWITFVTRSLTTAATLGRQDIADELSRLEASGGMDALRTAHGSEIDRIITELLNLGSKAQVVLCQQTDVKLLALALDRVQRSTFKLVELGRPDREPPADVIQPLLKLFHRMLLNVPEDTTGPLL